MLYIYIYIYYVILFQVVKIESIIDIFYLALKFKYIRLLNTGTKIQ